MKESYIKAILDNSPESIVLIGKDHKVLAFNRTMLEVLKLYHKREIKTDDYYYPDYVIDQNKQLYLDTFERAIKGETLIVEDLTVNENVSIWFEYRMKPVYDQAGTQLGVSLSAKDITNEKLGQLKIIELSERLKAILDNADESITLLDLDYKILEINTFALHALKSNTDIEAVTGSDFRDFIPDKNNIFYEYYPRSRKGEFLSAEIPYKNLNGELLWYQTKFNPVFDVNGKQIGVSIFANDITEKKRVETGLKESEERFKKISDLAPIGIIITNEKFKISYANKSSITMFGYDFEDFLGISISDLFVGLSLNKHNGNYAEEAELEIKPLTFHQEKFEARTRDTHKCEVLVSSSSFYNKENLNYIFIVQDITDILKKDELISNQNNRLRDIAWHQSHVIRAPVANILGLVSLLQDKTNNAYQVDTDFLYSSLVKSAQDLDKIIGEIVRKTD